jgi:hypothetical protein
MNGRTALQAKINKTGKVYHSLTPGLYFVRVKSTKVNAIKKVMIEQ